jgi:SAM-dependent methyltransferase
VAVWRPSVFSLAWALAWSLDAAGRAMAYLAAGVLTRASLRTAMTRNWETYGRDESFILSGLMRWEQECYDRVLRPGDTILLVGCGTGRDLIALMRRGHSVEGLDPAPGALAIAQQMLDKVGLRATLHRKTIEDAELRGTFDVVIFSASCYGYIPERRGRVAVLEKVTRHLNPGGRVVIFYSTLESRRTLPIRLTRLVTRLAGSDWMPEDGDKIWVSLADRRFVHFEHQFDDAELEAEAHAAGLRPLPDHPPTDGVCVLGQPA